MKATRVLNREDAVLVVVDVQERLVPAIDKELYARSLKNFKIAIEAAGTLGLPIVLTEQYPKGLGRTVPEVVQALEGKKYERIEKVAFSCARDEEFLSAIAKTARRQVVLIGMETHVCVYQTAMDLLGAGYEVQVVADCISSRDPENKEVCLAKMGQADISPTTTEMALFELLKVAKGDKFKQISNIVK
jgi:nicotinamidase-related amidase